MILPVAPPKYDKANEDLTRTAIKMADQQNYKHLKDVDLGKQRLIMTDTDDSKRYAITIASGAWVFTAL